MSDKSGHPYVVASLVLEVRQNAPPSEKEPEMIKFKHPLAMMMQAFKKSPSSSASVGSATRRTGPSLLF